MSSEKDIEKGIPWLLIIFMSIVAMLVTSYITGILITWPKQLVVYTSADANSWLQFWGSMLGGFIGTLAVIYVAHLQNKKQEEQLQIQNTLQEKLLDRQISQNEELNSKLIALEQDKIRREIYTNFLEKLVPFNKKIFTYTMEYEFYINKIKMEKENILNDSFNIDFIIKDYKKLKETENILYEEYTYIQQWHETINPNIKNKIKNIDFPIIDFYLLTVKDIENFLHEVDIDNYSELYLELSKALLKIEYEIVYSLKSLNSFGQFKIE